MIQTHDAIESIATNITRFESETVPLESAVGRVLELGVQTDIDSPPHSKSVMDGFAVIASDVRNQARLKVIETVAAGQVPTRAVTSGNATRIMTGAPLPDGADAVVMLEQTDFDNAAQEVTLRLDAIRPGHHVMSRGAAMKNGDVVFSPGRRLTSPDVGLLAECGAANVRVFRQPSIAVLPTGDELVSANEMPGPGKIRNSNGPMLVALAREETLAVHDLGVGRDNSKDLREKIAAGLQRDFLVLSGGVSAGMLDLVPPVLEELGVGKVFHKVAIKPGKPTWFGTHERPDGTRGFVFGLPGNPVSSLVCFRVFVGAALAAGYGRSPHQPDRIRSARLVIDHKVRGNRLTYWPSVIGQEGTGLTVTPLDWKGSSDLRALGKANGLAIFDASATNHFASGADVQVFHL